VRNETEIDAAVTTFGRESGGGLIAAPDPFINTYRALIISLAYLHRLPTLFAFRQHVRDGGLMSYGPDSVDIVRHSASYVDRILRGAKPAELPVQAPIKYELSINLKTAKALGLEIPPTLLARRRGDRMKMPLAALHESAIGPTQTSGDVRYRIALGGQADINRPSQFMSTRPRPSSTTGSTMGALDQSAD
jgi:hypothetical protein